MPFSGIATQQLGVGECTVCVVHLKLIVFMVCELKYAIMSDSQLLNGLAVPLMPFHLELLQKLLRKAKIG